MPTTVETARGPIATTELGPTLMHEHVVTRSPGVQENWPHLWDRPGIVALAEKKLADLHARGIRTIVDLTTVDLGRDIALIAEVAKTLARQHRGGHRRLVDAAALLQCPRRGRGRRSLHPRYPRRHRRQRHQGGHHQVRDGHRGRDTRHREHPARLRARPEGHRRADLHAHVGGRARRRDAAGDLRPGGRGPAPGDHRPQRRQRGSEVPARADGARQHDRHGPASASTTSCRRTSAWRCWPSSAPRATPRRWSSRTTPTAGPTCSRKRTSAARARAGTTPTSPTTSCRFCARPASARADRSDAGRQPARDLRGRLAWLTCRSR